MLAELQQKVCGKILRREEDAHPESDRNGQSGQSAFLQHQNDQSQQKTGQDREESRHDGKEGSLYRRLDHH